MREVFGRLPCHAACRVSDSNLTMRKCLYRGKKYKKLKASKDIEDDMKKYEPFLVASVNYPYVHCDC